MTTTPTRTQERPGARRRWRLPAWAPLLLVLAGVLVLIYPVAATQFNNAQQHQFAEQYNQQAAAADPSGLDADLAAAEKYNAGLSGVPILDPWLSLVSGAPKSGPYQEYQTELARFDALGTLRVPSASIYLPIYHGTTEDVLARGVGHLYGTSLPVGGTGTHSVLTSHTGLSNATLFDHLTQTKVGDLIYFEVYGRSLTYQVDQIKVVLPDQIDDLTVIPGQDLVTLFTCTPYALNTHRLLVRGHRVAETAADGTLATQPDRDWLTFEPWMVALVLTAAVGLVALAILWQRRQRQDSPAKMIPPRRTRSDGP